MNLIYIGYLYPDTLLQELIDLKSYIDFPAHSFQTALLKGLNKPFPQTRVISAAPVSAFPKIKKWYFRKEAFSHRGDNIANDETKIEDKLRSSVKMRITGIIKPKNENGSNIIKSNV